MADVTLTFAAKDAGFAAAMQRMQGRLSRFTRSMGALSAVAVKVRASFSGLTGRIIGLTAAYVGVTQAIAAFNKALGTADRLDDLSVITGESAGNLAILERAFVNTGVGGDRMLPMLARMTQFVKDLAQGSPRAVDAANLLGITFADLEKLTPVERLELFLRAIGRLKSENDQAAASTEVFGSRAGITASLLADLDNALAKARKQLGSLPDILNKMGRSLGDLNDTLKNSVFNKPSEFTIGFLAGVKGANDFAEALESIDAAGFGQRMGQLFSGMAQEPGQAFVAVGERLLEYVLRAGNALINASAFAGEVYKRALLDPEVFTRMKSGFMAVMGSWANWFNRLLASTIKTVLLEPLSQLPAVLGGSAFKTMLTGLEKVQQQLDADAASFGKALTDSLAGSTERTLEIARQMNAGRQDVDVLGAARQKQEADAAFSRLSQLGAPQSTSAAQAAAAAQQAPVKSAAEIQQIYNEQAQKLREANLGAAEFAEKLKQLNAQMYQAMRQNAVAPPVQQANDGAMSQPAREEAINNVSGKSASAMNEVASETTLQKVANFLEQLNTKLPQPVLV